MRRSCSSQRRLTGCQCVAISGVAVDHIQAEIAQTALTGVASAHLSYFEHWPNIWPDNSTLLTQTPYLRVVGIRTHALLPTLSMPQHDPPVLGRKS